jgi:hypothetical protein
MRISSVLRALKVASMTAVMTLAMPIGDVAKGAPRTLGGPGGMFIDHAELMSKPTSGAGWSLLKSKADMASYGVVDLGDKDSLTQSHVLAGALVYARTGETAYRDKVIATVRQACGTQADGPDHLLGLARTLFGYVVAADMVQMPYSTTCTNGQTWQSFLQQVRTEVIPGHRRWATLEYTSANTSGNWGAYALSSHLAVSYALNDTAAIHRDVNIFKRFLGDTTSPAAPFEPTAGYRYGDNGATWDMTATLQRGINPYSPNDPRDGALIEDALRGASGGDDSVRCCAVQPAAVAYQEETLDGILSTAQLLRANGVDLRGFQDNAMLRAFDFYITNGGPSTYGLSRYLPYAVNYLYGTSYRTQAEDRPYRHMGYGSWLFTGDSTSTSVSARATVYGAPAGSQTPIVGAPNAIAVLSVGVTNTQAGGYFQVLRCGEAPGAYSTLNASGAGETIAGLAIVQLDGSGRACVYSEKAAEVFVDLQGYLSPGAFTASPVRWVDTRSPAGNPPLPPGGRVKITGSSNGLAVVSVVATSSTAHGYLQALPCDAAPGAYSNLNVDRPGQTIANLAIVPLDARGEACIYTQGGGHVVVDLQGYLDPASFAPEPRRLTDTRQPPPQSALSRDGRAQVLARPDGVAVLSIVATETRNGGYVQVLGCGEPPGRYSNLNTDHAGQTIANVAITKFDAAGERCIYTQGGAHLVADLQGYFAPTAFVPVNERVVDTRHQ